jgi:predicted alpha/beta superfamily hydrolase
MQDASRLAFGGGSFAGVTALLAAVTLPHVFGGILVESPSLWVGEGRFLRVRRRAGLCLQFCGQNTAVSAALVTHCAELT